MAFDVIVISCDVPPSLQAGVELGEIWLASPTAIFAKLMLPPCKLVMLEPDMPCNVEGNAFGKMQAKQRRKLISTP